MSCAPELPANTTQPAPPQKLDLPPGIPPLISLYLYISGSCNLACRHCWISPEYEPDHSKGRFLELEWIKKAVREAKPLGLRSVKLTGGEPTLHPHFAAIIEYLDREGIDVLIETNGTLIDGTAADFLRGKRVMFVSVSLDGPTADSHEALRDVPGSFERAIRGIDALVRSGFKPQLICTLHRGNAREIERMARLAESMGCGSIKFNHLQLLGRGESFASPNRLAIGEILENYGWIQKELTGKLGIPIFYDIPRAFCSIKDLQQGVLNRCSIHNVLGILSGGEIALCGIGATVPELVYGRVPSNDLSHLWKSSAQIQSIRDEIPSSLDGICGQCLFRESCQGCCIANNYHRAGRLNAPYFFCEQAEKEGLFPETRKTKPHGENHGINEKTAV